MKQDDPLLDALAALPRERAGAGFTAAVLERLRRSDDAGPATVRLPWGLAAAGATLVVLSGAAAWWLDAAHRRAELRGELEALRGERARLERSLGELRASEKPPVVYLGGDDRVDLYLDLAELERLRRAGAAIPPTVVPVRGDLR
jgi:anti-sigma factor RsiW